MKNNNKILIDSIVFLIGAIALCSAGIVFFEFKIDNWAIEIEPPRKMIMNMSQVNFSYLLQCGCFLISAAMLFRAIFNFYFFQKGKKEVLEDLKLLEKHKKKAE